MSKIRVGVIGLGHGRRHIEGYREHPTAEVIAIADLDDERLDSVGREFGIADRYDAADALLARDDLDAVSICVPNKFHHDMTLTALGRGLHVLCEKPLAMDAAEATEMAETAAACDRRLTVNFAFRFTAEAQALKAQVAAGRLGGVYFARSVWHRRRFVPGFGGWFTRKQSSGGGAMIDIGVHRLDLALWLMDFPEPDWVLANHWDVLTAPLAEEAGIDFDVEDFAAATIRFKNGMMLAVEASWAANIKERELMETRLFGTHAGVVHRNVREGYEYKAELFFEDAGCDYDMRLSASGGPARSSMWHFIDSIENDATNPAPAEEAVRVQKIVDAIYESAESGRPVQVR